MSKNKFHERRERRPAPGDNVVPFAVREITLEVFVREKGALGQAFSTSCLLSSDGKTIKKTRADWQKDFDAWLSVPRGGGK